MLLARVVGPVWGSRHAEGLSGRKVLDLETASGQRLCAVDALGAGPGEWVLVAHGSRVRDLTVGATVAEKDIVVAIVDDMDHAAAPVRRSMIIGRVVGEVWATRRHAGLDGCKLLLVQPHLWYSPPFEVAHLVAVDTLGAGLGEDVVVCMGEPARRALAEAGGQADDPGWDAQIGYLGAVRLPVDAAVMAIVDQVQIAPGPGPGDSQLLGARPLRFVGPTPAWASPSSESAPSPSLSSEPRGAA